MMNTIFGDVSDHVAAYLDDVVIFNKSWEDHINHIQEALDRIRKAGLTKKCHERVLIFGTQWAEAR